MQQPEIHKKLDCCQFPQQKLLCDNKIFSHDLLQSLLENIYAVHHPFTGYLKFAGDQCSLLFLFFFNGAPYGAGRYVDGKPAFCTIQDLGRELVRSAEKPLAVTLCETDPVLLKSMMLFMQKDPDIKAPTSLLDFEYVVRQIGEVGTNAMIALCRDNKMNFYFFKDGKGALVHYADLAFEQPEGMTIDEEMLLYAFQPGDKVKAYVFRDMITTLSEDSSQLGKDSLYRILTVGYLENRRRDTADSSSITGEKLKDSRRDDTEIPPKAANNDIEILGNDLYQKPKIQSVIFSVESVILQMDRVAVTLPCTIGRKNCDLILSDRLVSRQHAELKIVENKLVIEDLTSTNGTKVNGKKIVKSGLKPNDLISIGLTNLRICSA